MFTGIVQAVNSARLEGWKLLVEDPGAWPGDDWVLGESIAVSGCCLTLVSTDSGLWFDVSEETLARTCIGELAAVNLERAMRPMDRFGGHIVQGHVDLVGRCLSVSELEGSWNYRFSAPGGSRYLIDKGSICLNGVSLTVVNPVDDEFDVAVIPHTHAVTTLGQMRAGDPVNVEFDVLVKHIERLITR